MPQNKVSGQLSFFTHLLNKHRDGAKALSMSVLNQIVTSGANFLFSIYLIRTLTPANFGVYGIIFATMLFYGGAGNALFLTQMVVNSPKKVQEKRLSYAGRILVMVVLFCFGTALMVAGAGLLVTYLSPEKAVKIPLVIVALAVAISYLLKEFFVRHYYIFRMESKVLTVNIAMAIGLFASIITFHYFNEAENITTSVAALAIGNFVGALVGFFCSGISRVPLDLSKLREDFLEAWSGGRWATASNFVYFARINAHTIVVTAVSGTAALGILNAARLFVTPAVMLIPAVGQVAFPRLASIAVTDVGKARKFGKVMTLIWLAATIMYAVFILSLYQWVAPLILDSRYGNLHLLVSVWCVYACTLAVRNGFEVVLLSESRFRLQALANIASAITTLSAVWFFGLWFGLEGFVMGLVLGEIFLIYLVRK